MPDLCIKYSRNYSRTCPKHGVQTKRREGSIWYVCPDGQAEIPNEGRQKRLEDFLVRHLPEATRKAKTTRASFPVLMQKGNAR